MTSMFLTLRYVAFALFILFNSVICVLAALNLGSLAPGTEKFPEVDSYLIFTGALAIVFVFPVIFIELFRKNAFISRVAVEITWVSIFWVMALSGAAAMTAITKELTCSPGGGQLLTSCSSAQALLAFTWLSTVVLLAYLFGLLVCTIHHSQKDGHVWQTGVRDYKWFSKTPTPTPEAAFVYGRIVDPREPAQVPPIYAQQMGLSKAYQVEPLQMDPAQPLSPPEPSQPPPANLRDFKFPARPAPALQLDIKGSEPYRTVPPPEPATSKPPISLYPQFVQASGGIVPQPPKPSGPTPPPAGSWPRSNPQEPLRKSRAARDRTVQSADPSSQDPSGSATAPHQLLRPVQPSTARSRPAGPRGASIDRLRAPP